VFADSSIDIIDNLQKENKFPEAFIVAWGVIEFTLDMVVLEEYKLPLENLEDPKAKVILDLNFSRKLDLQKKLKFLTNADAKIIERLREKRNSFFHSEGFFISALSEDQKQEIIRIAKKAIIIIFEIVKKLNEQDLPKTER
jgi:predicted butyrate kinase (DUF1464 family)